MMDQNEAQDSWLKIRNLTGIILILVGIVGMVVVFWLGFNLIYGLATKNSFMLEVEKLITGADPIFIQIVTDSGIKKIELARGLISLISFFLYIILLKTMGGLALGSLNSGVQLAQTDFKGSILKLKDEIMKLSLPKTK